MIKIIMMLLTILCLSSCQSTFSTQLVCAQFKKHEIKPHRSCDISFERDRCRCRCFDMNEWNSLPLKTCPEFADSTVIKLKNTKTGEKSEAVDKELEYCEGVSGPFLQDIANDIRPNVKAMANIKANLCH